MKDNKFDIICAGHTVVDVIVPDIEDLNFSMGDRIEVDDIILRAGGDALNQSLFFGSTGVKTGLFTIAGSGTMYEPVKAGLEKFNVVRIDDTERHGADIPISIVLLETGGQRKFITHRPRFRGEFNFPFEVFNSAKFLSYASFHGNQDLDLYAPEIFRIAKKMGVTICADMTGGGRYSDDSFRRCIEFVDYFMPSIEEARVLTGETGWKKIAGSLRSMGFANVILKLGEDGCFVSGKQGEIYIPAYEDLEIVDTTGAGDSFVAGFVYGLYKGMDVEKASRFAQAAAAVCISRLGASGIDNMIDKIEAFLSERGIELQ